MTKQVINVGATANDKKGDSLRAAFQKVNANFSELYTALSTGGGGTIDLSAVNQHIIPALNNTYDLGSSTHAWRSLYVSTHTIFINNVPLSLDVDGNLTVNDLPVANQIDYTLIPNAPTDIADLTDNSGLLGGTSYNQSLNTTDNVTFNKLKIANSLHAPAAGGAYDKIKLYDFGNVAKINYAIGTEDHHIWMSVDDVTAGFKWYGGTNLALTLLGNGTITLPGGAQIIPKIQGGNSIDIKAGAGTDAWAELLSNNERNFIWVDDNGSYIGSNLTNQWTFGTDGYLRLPGTGGGFTSNSLTSKIRFDGSNVKIETNSGANSWTFGLDGKTYLPNYTLPSAAGTTGQVLGYSGSTLTWFTPPVNTGPKGDTGDKGDTGAQGSQGAKGDKGDTGAQGPAGPQGSTGLQGPKGDTGNTGSTGAKGDKGDQGVPGSTGAQGDPGDKGDKGDTGAQGVSVTLQGTKATIADLPAAPLDPQDYAGHGWIVTTGDGVTHLDGSLWFWNLTEQAWNDIGQIVGPQGDQGPQGPAGARGAQGDQGPAGNDGADGAPGAAGANGADGTSFVWASAWDAQAAYSANDVVEYLGSSYIATQASENTDPTNTDYWALMSAKGDTGAQGEPGISADQELNTYNAVQFKNLTLHTLDVNTLLDNVVALATQLNDAFAVGIDGTPYTGAGYPASYNSYGYLTRQQAINPLIPNEWITIATDLHAAYNLYYAATTTLNVDTTNGFTITNGLRTWKFSADGVLTVPQFGDIVNYQGTSAFDIPTTDRLVNGSNSLVLEDDGSVTAPYGKLGVATGEVFGIVADVNTAATIQADAGAQQWSFDTGGNLTIPGNIKQGNTRINLNENGLGDIYMTPVADDTTALYLVDGFVDLYARDTVVIGTRQPDLMQTAANENSANNNVIWVAKADYPNFFTNVTTDWQLLWGGQRYAIQSITDESPIPGFVTVTMSDNSLTFGYRTIVEFHSPVVWNGWEFNADGEFLLPQSGAAALISTPNGGSIQIQPKPSDTNGGNLYLYAGAASTDGDTNGGNVTILASPANGEGNNGKVNITTANGTWEFDGNGNFNAPGDINTPGSITANNLSIDGDGSVIFNRLDSRITEARPSGDITFNGLSVTTVTGIGAGATVTVSYYPGDTEYTVTNGYGGSDYAVGDHVLIPGNLLGGTTPANDCLITITELYPSSTVVFSAEYLSGTPLAYPEGLHIRTGGYEWTFGNDGRFVVPGGTASIRSNLGYALITTNTDETTGVELVTNGATPNDNGVNLYSTDGKVTVTTEGGIWAFGTDGGLTFPDDTVQTTAYIAPQTGLVTRLLVNGVDPVTYTEMVMTDYDPLVGDMTPLNIQGGDYDDDYIAITFPFNITYNGSYWGEGDVYLGSNGYITFGAGSTDYGDLWSNPVLPSEIADGLPALLVMAGDNSWQNAYTYHDTTGGEGNGVFIIRWEGNSSNNFNFGDQSNRIFEVIFYEAVAGQIDIRIIQQDGVADPGDVSYATDGSNWLGSRLNPYTPFTGLSSGGADKIQSGGATVSITSDGVLHLPLDAKIGNAYGDQIGVDLYIPATSDAGWVGINYDNRNWVYVEDGYVGIEMGTNYWYFNADATVNFAGGYKFPNTRGTAGQVLVTDAQGNLTWQDQSGSGNANTGNFVFNNDNISNENYSYINSNVGVSISGGDNSYLYVDDTGAVLESDNPNFEPAPGEIFSGYVGTGQGYGFEEVLGTDFIGPAMVVGATGTHNGQLTELASMWTVNGKGNLVTVNANLFGTGGAGYNVEYSTGDITDKDGNSLVYVPASDTAPTHNINGLLWYNSDEGRTYIRYDDQWVDASPTVIPPLVEPTRLLNGDYELDLSANGLLSFGTEGASVGFEINGAGEGLSLGYPTILSLTQDDENPNALTIRNRLAGLDKGLAIYVTDEGEPILTSGASEQLSLIFTKDNLLTIGNSEDKADFVIGEFSDGDAVIWAQPKPYGETEYLGLWWAGITDLQGDYGPDAAITIGTNSNDDMQNSEDIDPDTQVNVAIGDNRWKFAADGSLRVPGGGWDRDTSDIFANDSLFIRSIGDSLRIIWNNDLDVIENGDAVFVRNEQRKEGFGINVGEKYSGGFHLRGWKFRPDGVIELPATIGDIWRDGASVLGGDAVTEIDGGAADTWLTPSLTANVAERVKTVPQHSTGAQGDRQGDTAYDANYMYYCVADYTTGTDNIWVKNAWTANAW